MIVDFDKKIITEQEIIHVITASYENKFDVIGTGSFIHVSGNTLQATITA